MKATVGYITSWRRAIFFSLVISIILFGTASTLCTSYLGPGLHSNIISVGVLVLCIGGFILVLADKFNWYTGTGSAIIQDGCFVYNDKKRHFNINLNEIDKVDIEKIVIGREGSAPLAYRILIKTGKKKYYIESDRAAGRQMTDIGIYDLYLYIMQNKK